MNKNYEKRQYIQDVFYTEPRLLPELFEDLLTRQECKHEFDMYDNGEFLSWEVYRGKCEDLLSVLISDIAAYRHAASEVYNTDPDFDVIQIALLYDHYVQVHGNECSLYWSEFMHQFLSSEEFHFIDSRFN